MLINLYFGTSLHNMKAFTVWKKALSKVSVFILYKLRHICDDLVEFSVHSFTLFIPEVRPLWNRQVPLLWNWVLACENMQVLREPRTRGQIWNYFKVCRSVSFKFFPAVSPEFQGDKSYNWLTPVVGPE